jgi:FtsH-binding integral membrane protein
MNVIFVVATIIFLALGVFFSAKDKDDREKMKQDVLMYSVVPSLIFGTIGHLFLASKTREDMGWDNSTGVITLQRELGLFTASLLVIALTKKEPGVGLGWGLFLLAAGINHIIVNNKVGEVAMIDIVYGLFLMLVFKD